MSTHDLAPAEAMFDARERYLSPCVLSPFAEDMARRLSRWNNGPLLEIMADTGALTSANASALPPGVSIVATDPNRRSVEAASRKTAPGRVTWHVAEPIDLPFAAGTFGLIACQFGVALLQHRVAAMREVRRVMVPGGRFIFSVPGPLRFNPVARCVQEALEWVYGTDTPEVIPRLHGYADDEVIDDDLTEAGFTDAMYTNVDLPFVARVEEAAMGYCLGTALRGELEHRGGTGLDTAVGATIESLRKRFGSEVIRTTMRALVVSASA